MNSFYPRLVCAKFGWNWISGSGGGDFLILSLYFSLFCNYLPLEKNAALHLNKLESPLPKDALCQVWLKLAQWFWRIWKCESNKITCLLFHWYGFWKSKTLTSLFHILIADPMHASIGKLHRTRLILLSVINKSLTVNKKYSCATLYWQMMQL